MTDSFQEKQHAMKWSDEHNRYMSAVLAFRRAGYGMDESHRMAERHRIREPILQNHNRGPLLDSD